MLLLVLAEPSFLPRESWKARDPNFLLSQKVASFRNDPTFGRVLGGWVLILNP